MYKKIFMVEYEIGNTVFLRHDPEQLRWMITAIIIKPDYIQYEICSGEKNLHVDSIELSLDKQIF